eukprot:11449190-Alexandrium_andersonii.AAC.1
MRARARARARAWARGCACALALARSLGTQARACRSLPSLATGSLGASGSVGTFFGKQAWYATE